MKLLKIILVQLCISTQLFSLTNINPRPSSSDSAAYISNPNYNLQIGMYEIYKTRQADIVMLGNSLTHGANWNELLGRSNVVERGISSDVTEGVLNRLQYVFKLKPKVCFIMAGLNDVYNWIPVEDIYRNYVRIIKLLETKKIKSVIQSTIYSGRDWGKNWNLTPEINAARNVEVAKLNKLLKEFAKENNIEFLDINSKMKDGNFLKSDLTYDGVHLNSRGYKIWGREIEKVLKTLGM